MARNGKQCTPSSDNEPYPFFVISVPAFYKYIIGCAPPGGKSDTPEFSIEFTKSHISSMPRIKSNLCRSNLIVPDLWKTSQLCVQRQTPCFEATIKIILKKNALGNAVCALSSSTIDRWFFLASFQTVRDFYVPFAVFVL